MEHTSMECNVVIVHLVASHAQIPVLLAYLASLGYTYTKMSAVRHAPPLLSTIMSINHNAYSVSLNAQVVCPLLSSVSLVLHLRIT